MPHPELLTDRLRLYPPRLAELEAHIAMEQDPAVMRYLHPPRPAEALRAEYRAKLESGWPEVGAVYYVAWRDRPGLLGWIGLYPLEERAGAPSELGYLYRPEAWGQGVATEAGEALLAYGFGMLGLDPIVAVTDPAHVRSQRVLRKLGLADCGTRLAYGETCRYFRARRAAWLAGRLPPLDAGRAATP